MCSSPAWMSSVGTARVAPILPPVVREALPALAPRARGLLLGAVETLVLTLILFVLIQTFVARPRQIRQESMENTLLPNQYVLVDKLTPRFDSYQRGDIVVFIQPGSSPSSTRLIKRVIGLPGDTIDLRDGHVVINGQELSEPYVYPGQVTEPLTGRAHWVVPAGMLFVLGDQREVSSDSRVFGPVPIANVIGRAWLRYWPLSAFEVIATPTYPDLRALGVPSAASSGVGGATRAHVVQVYVAIVAWAAGAASAREAATSRD